MAAPTVDIPRSSSSSPLPPLLTLEEHFFSERSLNGPSKDRYSEQLRNIPGVFDKLKDLGPLRIQDMDENSVSLQVISHGPTQPPLNAKDCREANLQLHKALCEHPTRFAAFAALPMGDPDDASKELAFCVEELGFVGALIDNHADGHTYEGPDYRGFWYTVQSLGVPIYLHPSWATQQIRAGVFPDVTDQSGTQSGLQKSAVDSLMASSWNWHSDVALHVFKLFASGLFDKLPRLKIILGHFGEMIPYQLKRIQQLSPRWNNPPLKRDFKTVWDENVWVTTSGVWGLDPLKCMLSEGNTKLERILFSVDYPFAKNECGKTWMEDLIKSGILSEKEVEAIAYRNAEKLLGVRVKRPEEDDDKHAEIEEGEQ